MKAPYASAGLTSAYLVICDRPGSQVCEKVPTVPPFRWHSRSGTSTVGLLRGFELPATNGAGLACLGCTEAGLEHPSGCLPRSVCPRVARFIPTLIGSLCALCGDVVSAWVGKWLTQEAPAEWRGLPALKILSALMRVTALYDHSRPSRNISPLACWKHFCHSFLLRFRTGELIRHMGRVAEPFSHLRDVLHEFF